MHRSNYISDILFLFSAVLRGTASIDTATVSITAAPGYAIEPACVQSCVFYNSFDVADYLVVELGCTSTIYNACYCTQIADQSASNVLSSCVNTLCRGTTEISNAISLYESYCSGAGYPRSVSAAQTTSTTVSSNPVSQSASVTSSSTSITTTPTATSPPSSIPSSSSSSSSSPSSSSTLSSSTTSSSTSSSNLPLSSSTTSNSKSKTGPIVGGVIGGLAGLALIIGIIFIYLRRSRQNSGQGHHQEAGALSGPMEEPKKQVGGRAELDNQKNKPTIDVAQADSMQRTEIQGEGRQGWRPEELDASGRYMGELHGDGRHVIGAELE